MINSRRISGDDYWYKLNAQGSVTNIVDADDNVVKSYTYDAYGNTSSTGAFINSFAYTGAVIDIETGLYYMNARYYEPETGRFVSEDSYRGDEEEFWHLYVYCNGDPVNNMDPTGNIPMEGIDINDRVTKTEKRAFIGQWLVFQKDTSYPEHINLELAYRLALFACAMNKGKITISYGYRTKEEQGELYYHGKHAIYKNKKFIKNDYAAKPGTSLHEMAFAVDVGPTGWLCELYKNKKTKKQTKLTRFGLYKSLNNKNTTPYEPWHIEMIETIGNRIVKKRQKISEELNARYGFYK